MGCSPAKHNSSEYLPTNYIFEMLYVYTKNKNNDNGSINCKNSWPGEIYKGFFLPFKKFLTVKISMFCMFTRFCLV